jgi:cysteine desulfurase/selenocysteine lyase
MIAEGTGGESRHAMATLTDRPDHGALLDGWPHEIIGLDKRVPLLDGTLCRYVNLDNAASTPPFLAAQDAIDRFAPWYASVHRGTGFKSQLSTHVFEAARAAVARFVGADTDSHVVVFVKNTTEALNKLSHVLGADGTVVYTTIMEHHANMLPWRVWAGGGVRFVATDADGSLDLADLERQLAAAPTDRPRLVALAGAYNITGYTPPIHAIARVAHRHGARLLVDGAQLVPHLPTTMRGSGDDDAIDVLVVSGHKLYAPYGAGVLVAPRTAFHGLPDQLGGGIVDLVTLANVVWTEVPEREEAGSPNVIGVVGLYAAIEKLTQLGMANVARHEQALTAYALEKLAAVPGLRVLGPQTTDARVGAISFVLRGVSHTLVAAILSYEFGIGVRAGCFCAHPGMAHLLGVSAEDMATLEQQIMQHEKFGVPGATRASLALYNSADDVDSLVEALHTIGAGRYRGTYILDRATNEYTPEGWRPDFDTYFSITG